MTGSDPIAVALVRIAEELGPGVMESPQRLRAALSDVLGPSARAQRASVDAICLAAEDGVSRDLASARAAGLLSDDTISALARRLVGRGLSQEMATRTVRDLAGAQSSSSSSGSSSAVVEQTRLAGGLSNTPADEPRPVHVGGAPIPSPGPPAPTPGRGGRLAVVAALLAMLGVAIAGVVYGASHQGASTPGAPATWTITSTATTTQRVTVTRSVTTTATRRVTVSGGVTFDESHFRATDYASTFAPKVGPAGAGMCVYHNVGHRSGNPCYYYFYAENFGSGDLRVRSARLVKGAGATWVADNNVYYQVTRNGPATVVIAVTVDRGGYRSTADLTLTIRCNRYFRCGGNFSS